MKTFTYLRQTADSVSAASHSTQVIGSTTSKYIAQEVDEFVRRRLNTRTSPSTNSKRVQVVKSSHPKIKVGTIFPSGREACRALGVPIQSMSTAFFRGGVDASGARIGEIDGVTFKQLLQKCRRV
jgi:hypothetical protein